MSEATLKRVHKLSPELTEQLKRVSVLKNFDYASVRGLREFGEIVGAVVYRDTGEKLGEFDVEKSTLDGKKITGEALKFAKVVKEGMALLKAFHADMKKEHTKVWNKIYKEGNLDPKKSWSFNTEDSTIFEAEERKGPSLADMLSEMMRK